MESPTSAPGALSSPASPPVIKVRREDAPLAFLGGIPGDALSSHGGEGTSEALKITTIFESAGITCCVVGISALIYFGAGRLRGENWEICVPTEMLERATAILKSSPYNNIYETYPPGRVQLSSLYHTFPRFKMKGVSFWVLLIPSEDCHLECKPSNLERSKMGLPYPKLDIFAQSLLETDNRVDLTDLIDGMDLSEEWGLQNLDLSGTNDVEWAEKKNVKIRESVPEDEDSCLLELSAAPWSKAETWTEIVRKKANRIGIEMPKEYFATRFRLKGDLDPRLSDRTRV